MSAQGEVAAVQQVHRAALAVKEERKRVLLRQKLKKGCELIETYRNHATHLLNYR